MNKITRRAPVKVPNAPSSLSLSSQTQNADADAHVQQTYKAASSSSPPFSCLATNSGPLNNVRATRQAQV